MNVSARDEEGLAAVDSPQESAGVTVHVVITPREAPPALGPTGGEMPFGTMFVAAALICAGTLLVVRRSVERRSAARGAAHPS